MFVNVVTLILFPSNVHFENKTKAKTTTKNRIIKKNIHYICYISHRNSPEYILCSKKSIASQDSRKKKSMKKLCQPTYPMFFFRSMSMFVGKWMFNFFSKKYGLTCLYSKHLKSPKY